MIVLSHISFNTFDSCDTMVIYHLIYEEVINGKSLRYLKILRSQYSLSDSSLATAKTQWHSGKIAGLSTQGGMGSRVQSKATTYNKMTSNTLCIIHSIE